MPSGRSTRLRLSPALWMATGALLVAGAAVGQQLGVDLVWDDRPDFADSEAVEHVALKGGQVFAAVVGDRQAGSRIVAYDQGDGSRLWQSRLRERITGFETQSFTSTVFTGGLLERDVGPSRLVTRALSADDGSERWRRFDSLGSDDPSPPAFAQRGDDIFLVGGSADRFMVHAIDTSGQLRWRAFSEPGDGVLAESLHVAFFGLDTLYVAGTRHRAPGEPSPMVVRAYDADTGEVLWETELGDGVGTPRDILVSQRVRVLVVGETLVPGPGLPRWTVHAVSSADGGHLWTDMPFPARRASSSAAAIVEQNSALHVVGHVSRARQVPVIRTYDASGDLRWQRRGAAGRRGTFEDVAFHLFRGIVAVGSGGRRGGRALAMTFDRLDGTTLWRRFGPAGTGGAGLCTVAARAGSVVAGGSIGRGGGDSDGLLHLYDVESTLGRR